MKSRKTKRLIFWATILLSALIIPLQFAEEAQANHTFDTKLRFTGATSPLTQSYTCGSGATLLVLGIVTEGNTARTGGAPTYNGTAMTQVNSTRIATETNVEMWYLANPSTGSAYTISVPNSNTRTLYVTASSYKAASGKTSTLDVSNGDQQTSANPYVCVTTTADGDAIVDILGDGLDTAPTANDSAYTLLYSTDDGAYSDNAQYRIQPAAGADCPDWTVASDDWAMIVGAFKEVVVPIYYSVGTDSSALYSGNASASNGVLTLASSAVLKIGVGDEVRIASSNRYYITGRSSSTSFTIQDSGYPSGAGTPGATNITFSSTSITIYRAFNLLSTAYSNSSNSSHLKTSDLVTGGYQLNWVCYADGVMTDTLTLSQTGWTTGSTNYIKIYTPTSTSQVGISQRHNGTWGTGFRMTPSGSAFLVSEDYVRIEGIAIQAYSGANSSIISISSTYGTISDNNDVRISHCLLYGQTGTYNSRGVFISDSNSKVNVTIWNTIAYNHGGSYAAFHFGTLNTASCYNCTAYNSYYGFYKAVATGTDILKNCLSLGNTNSDYVWTTNAWDASSEHNMSGTVNTSDSRQAPGPDIDSGTTAAVTTTTTVKLDSTSGISAGDWFNNTTRKGSARIASVDDSTTLTLSEAIASQTTGDSYNVKHSAWYRSASNNFVSTTGGSEDLHLKAGADAINVGTSLSGTFTDDIDGETRSGTWDMGVDEYYPPDSFDYRKLLTINYAQRDVTNCGTSYNLQNFPVLVSLSNKTWLKTTANGGHVYSPAGYDIIFRVSGSKTQLSHEIEKYDGEAGTLVAWVKIPDLFASNADTKIYIYYGNSDITTETEDPAGVWSNSYARVFHLNGNANDSTGTFNGSVSGATSTADGKIAGAYSFDGNDSIDTNLGPNYGTGNFTVEAWYYENSFSSGSQYVVGSRITGGAGVVMYQRRSGDYFVTEVFDTSGSSDDALRSGTFFSAWHYVALTRSGTGGSGVKGYMDNNAAVTGSCSGSVDLNGNDYAIGALNTSDSLSNYFNGIIDEVRFSSVARDACWIGTTYNSMNSPGTFITEGAEEIFYEYRKPLTLNYSQRGSSCGTSYDLSDFPVLVKLEGSWLRTKTNDSTNGRIYSEYGYDIIFRGPDDNTQLSHEVEKYDGSASGGSLIAWVKVPSLFAGNANTTIYMYYGNSSVTAATENPTGVWNSNYVAVYHLKETSGTHYDSTSNDNDSTSVSVATQGSATGKIDGADDFNGSSNQIVVGDKDSLDITSAITIEAWIYPDSLANKGRIVTKGGEKYVLRVNNEASAMLDGYVDENGTLKHAKKSGILVTTDYQHVAMTWASSGTAQPVKLYYNGSEVTGYTLQESAASPLLTSTDPLYIGSHGTGEYFDGRMDEVRISKVARDACWIGTTYNTMNSPSSFVAEGQAGDAPTGIELNSFAARGEGSAVNVQWQTKTEVDNLGFNLYRSTERNGTYTKLNSSLIPGLLSSVKGKRYSFTDANVTKGKVYYYKLEDTDLKGKRTVHGPVCVDWDRDGIPDDVDPDVRDSDSAPGRGSGGGGSSGGGDTSGGDFWVYGDSTVTRVNLLKFKAHETQGGVLVEWQTGYEVDNLGFHLYREVDGEVLRLTPELVAGSALLAGSGTSLRAGHQYRWWDISAIADVQGSLTLEDRPSASRTVPQAGLEANNSSASSEALLKRSAPRAKRSVLYWLEDVDLSGKRTMHGPAEIQPSALSSQLSASDFRRAELMSEFGKKLNKRYEEFWKAQELREKLKNVNRYKLLDKTEKNNTNNEARITNNAPSVGGQPSAVGGPQANIVVPSVDEGHGSLSRGQVYPTPSDKPPKVFPAVQQALAAGPAVKLLVKEEGWYRVSSSELQGAGLSSRVDPQFLRLYTEGVEIPLGVISEKQGKSVSLEAIEFYGVGVDTPSTDTRVYWLVEGRQPGKRVELSRGQGGQTGASSFPYTVEKKDRVFYFAGLKNGDASNFFGPVINQEPADQILEVRHLDLPASGYATLEVRIQGVTALPHQVNVFLNEIAVGTLSWEGQVLKTGLFSLPQSYLLEGENLVTLVASGGETDVSLLDSIRLTYWHTYRAYEDELRCQAPGGTQGSIDGFSTPEVRVFDITDAGGVFEVETKGKPVDTGYGVTFRVPGSGARTLLALTDQRMKTPAGIRANQPSSWRKAGGYDFVIVSHGDFIDSLSSLEALRKSQGLSVGVVDIEDVYDEFNFGMKSPQALKDFLSHAGSSWSRPPRFVLLVGDASFDSRNYLGFGDQDYVPTKLIETVYLETASDDWFVDFDNDGLPEMAIGRLPVQTAEEAATVVSKMIGYKKSGEKKEALLVADRVDNPDDFNFEGASEEVRALLPAPILVRKIFRGQFSSDAQAKAELLGGINQGPLLVNFIGHGSVAVWNGSLLTANDAESLINGLQLPLFVNMTCLNGFFQDPSGDSIAEALLKAQGGGAIAIWASSGFTEPDKQAVMNKEMIRLLFNSQGLTIGEAAMRAKASTNDQDIRRTWILFGDPATRLRAGY